MCLVISGREIVCVGARVFLSHINKYNIKHNKNRRSSTIASILISDKKKSARVVQPPPPLLKRIRREMCSNGKNYTTGRRRRGTRRCCRVLPARSRPGNIRHATHNKQLVFVGMNMSSQTLFMFSLHKTIAAFLKHFNRSDKNIY